MSTARSATLRRSPSQHALHLTGGTTLESGRAMLRLIAICSRRLMAVIAIFALVTTLHGGACADDHGHEHDGDDHGGTVPTLCHCVAHAVDVPEPSAVPIFRETLSPIVHCDPLRMSQQVVLEPDPPTDKRSA